jgi:SagB-type dehydrogenase family enzyme
MSYTEFTRRGFLKFAGVVGLYGSFLVPGKLLAMEKRGPLTPRGGGKMKLPDPVLDGEVSLERTIHTRRTVRSFRSRALSLQQLSQVLWAAQGITETGGFKRAAPSAGALYPMDVYGVIGKECIEKLTPGVYHYTPTGHTLSLIQEGDARRTLAEASLWQVWMAEAPLNLVITAEYSRITIKYGQRGVRYAMIEAGHIGQNIFLQCQAMGLEAGIVGAFDDSKVIQVMGIKKTHEPLLIMPVGYVR